MTDTYRNLLVGCGHARDKRLEPALFVGLENSGRPDWHRSRVWQGELHTLDYESPCKPDMVWDLNVTPWCRLAPHNYLQPDAPCSVELDADYYDEVHAYEVLEHLGQQGNYRAFLSTFSEVWRILKPGGFLCATVPSRRSQWLWGDPGHTRAILPCTLVFLDQQMYIQQHGVTSMSDYRRIYRADFQTVYSYESAETHQFILRAVKPSRCQL